MADFKSRGLYYESKDIRNSVLMRNIGEYAGYKYSMLYNGGLAIGMPYAVETEYIPYTLAERSTEGLQVTISPGQVDAYGKRGKPNVNFAWKEGGLFGYTHEVISNEYDWLSRNANIMESYYDYDSTEDMMKKLDSFPHSLPWGRGNDIIGGTESGGLRAFSSYNDPQNSVYYDDYTDYVREIFTNGISFDKHLGEHYVTNLLYDGFSNETIDAGVVGFIDEKSGFIIDDVDEDLKPIEDTKLAYIGRIMLGEEKDKQIKNVERVGKGLYITNTLGLYYGLSSASLPTLKQEMLGGAGVSYDFDMADSLLGGDSRFIVELDKSYDDEVLDNENTDEDETYLGYSVSNPQMRYLRDVHERARRSQSFYRDGINDKYVEYYNVRDYGATIYSGDFNENGEYDENLPGVSSVVNDEMRRENVFGDSVEGFFRAVGVYDENIESNEHYDEQDGINSGERDVLSRKDSYHEPEKLGLSNQIGFSSSENSLLEKTKKLFEQHKIKTLVGRFHTSNDDDGSRKFNLTQTATNETYGMSHGRNLLKLNPTYENGYENPYCRVWTYHHQYSKMTDLIRPFVDDGGHFVSMEELQANYPGRPIISKPAGAKGWNDKTVLNKNGMVNIAPSNRKSDTRVETKKCMFSIENLAWKGVKKDSLMADEFEVGPLGGRIMWFPPYNLTFNESVSVGWGSNDFIGRGEKIYSYSNTERTGSISFTILADHPSILSYWMRQKYMNQPGDEEGDQEVLRFFAGCGDGLDVDLEKLLENDGVTLPSKEPVGRNDPKTENDRTTSTPDDNQDPKPTPGPPDEFTKDNSISFYVYYPNNLSCMDFINNPKVGANYLVNGKNGFEFDPVTDFNNDIKLADDGTGSAKLDATNVVVGNWAKDIYMNTSGPGYEMGRSGGKGLTDETGKDAVMEHNINGSAADKGRNYIWGYGIDRIYVKQRLCGPHGPKGDETNILYPENYADSADFSLNNTPNIYDDACDYSFMDVAEAITPSPAAGGYNYSGKSLNPGKVEKIREILGLDGSDVENNKKRKYFFAVAGGASVHGYQTKNEDLSTRRANFVKAWLEYCFTADNLTVDYDETSKIPIKTGIEGGEESLEVNSESAKRGRYAKAVIYWYDEDVKDATESDKLYESGVAPETIIMKEEVKSYADKITDQTEVGEDATIANTMSLKDYYSSRYNNEELFFKVLEDSDKSLYKRITDKVKFFDPAFHSITPEGFNSRLAFLHQCTRQGPTISSSDISQSNGFNGAGYAGNLSFGRPPVCVLRLGDFFNTRILITSLNIQYDQVQWDLNPEGIGVQPMLANVTLGIVFQGGSSLGGPIQRLQNAVSFNYYANQEVYDDRADSAVYNEDGTMSDETYIWIPGQGGSSIGEVKKMFESKPYEINKKEVENNNDVTKDEIKSDDATKTAEMQRIARQQAANGLASEPTSGV